MSVRGKKVKCSLMQRRAESAKGSCSSTQRDVLVGRQMGLQLASMEPLIRVPSPPVTCTSVHSEHRNVKDALIYAAPVKDFSVSVRTLGVDNKHNNLIALALSLRSASNYWIRRPSHAVVVASEKELPCLL